MNKMKKWCIVDDARGTIYVDILDAITEGDAVADGIFQYMRLSRHDRKQRMDFYVAYGEVEDGELDFDSIEREIDIRKKVKEYECQ